MLATLDLPHMRALNARQLGQCFLARALLGTNGPNGPAEGAGRLCLVGSRTCGPASLNRTLLH